MTAIAGAANMGSIIMKSGSIGASVQTICP